MLRRNHIVSLAVFLALALVLSTGRGLAGGLPDYPSESNLLVDTPGTTRSVAGGLFNPAAWTVQRGGGLFLAWDDVAGDLSRDDYTGVLSTRHFGFGVRQFQRQPTAGEPFQVRDYTLGMGVGNRTSSAGVSYSWGGGQLDREARHERLGIGSITRCRFGSLGLAAWHDLEVDDNSLQADLGFRPLGPRLTLFADAVLEQGQSLDDIHGGYGLEIRPLPGLAIAVKARSAGEVSLRLGVALGRYDELGWRPHLDDGGHRLASTYALELGPSHGWFAQGILGHPTSYPKLKLAGRLAYQRYRLFDDRQTLLGTLARIQALADDPNVAGVIVDLSGSITMTPEMMWEVREQLAGLRVHGKKVIVYLDRANTMEFMLASVADQLWMDPQGDLDLRGLATGRTFMRHAFEKLGLGVDEWRFFTYKSAFESYSRDSMSEPDREQRQALLDDFYAVAVNAITSARGISRQQWEQLVEDKGILQPGEAKAAGLVDEIGGIEVATKSVRQAARRTTTDEAAAPLAGVTGDPVWGPEQWGEPACIALLYAIGECDLETGIRGRVLSEAIRRAGENRNVKAVVLRADSPGGDPLPSDLVAREMLATAKKKPVIVSQGQVAASGGYWISMYGDTIVTSPLTITGSIGVIGGWIWNEKLGEKIGLDYDGVKRGASADLGEGIRLPFVGAVVPDRALTSAEHDRMEALIRGSYQDFVAKVAQGRGLDEKYVDSIGQGRAWSGSRAIDNKLADEIGGLWRSLQLAKAAAHLPPDRPIEIAEGPTPGYIDFSAFKPKLFGIETIESTATAGVDPPAPLTNAERDFLRHLLRANGRPLFMMEPFEIHDGAPQP